jgi:hypothetical protein
MNFRLPIPSCFALRITQSNIAKSRHRINNSHIDPTTRRAMPSASDRRAARQARLDVGDRLDVPNDPDRKRIVGSGGRLGPTSGVA